MGLLDSITKKAKELADSAAKSVGEAANTAKSCSSEIASKVGNTTTDIAGKVGNSLAGIASNAAKCIGEGVSYIGESLTEASEGDYAKLKGMASATGDFFVDAAKDMTGINAYNHYQSAKINREEADNIVRNVETEVGKVRYLANDRLQCMGQIRLDALKNTVGRFIKIVERMNQGVRDKEYEMLTRIDMSQEELKEMEVVTVNQQKMLTTAGIGVSAAAAAAYGSQFAIKWGVQKLAAASTGTAIKQLSGAAAEKATMAWLGGGSVASGGGGGRSRSIPDGHVGDRSCGNYHPDHSRDHSFVILLSETYRGHSISG